jgi:hypothetical protein
MIGATLHDAKQLRDCINGEILLGDVAVVMN